jgi:nucleoside phosphorylase
MDKAENFKGKVHFGVITIRSDEYQALLEQLPKTSIVDGNNERRYRVAQLGCSDGSEVTVAVTRCLEQGNIEAQKAAVDLVQDLAPQWILVVGIAGGVPDSTFSLGDVVVSSRVYDLSLESAKPGGEREYSIKGEALHPYARRIVQDIPGMLGVELKNWHLQVGMDRPELDLAKLDGRLWGDGEWRKSLEESLIRHFSEARFPLVLPGAIASSDRLIKDPEITADWKKVARHFVAIEMELAGVCRALWDLPALGIRGISDIVGLKRDEVWTTYACKTAAAFAVSLIQFGSMPLKRSESYSSIALENEELYIQQSHDTFQPHQLPDNVFGAIAAELSEWILIHNDSQTLLNVLNIPFDYLTSYRFEPDHTKLDEAGFKWQKLCVPKLRDISNRWQLQFANTPLLDDLREQTSRSKEITEQLMQIETEGAEFNYLYLRFEELRGVLWELLIASDKRMQILMKKLKSEIEV